MSERYNTADSEQVGNRRRSEKRERENELEDLRAVLELPAGRRLLWRLITAEEWCGVFRSSYHPSGQQFAANEGRRGVGVQLMGELMELDPQAWIAMQSEQLKGTSKA